VAPAVTRRRALPAAPCAAPFAPLRRGAPLLALALAGCGGVLDPRGPVGEAQKTILFNALSIMLCIVVPVIVLTGAFAWWFRASNPKATYMPDWAYSGRVELVVWSVPALTVMFLAGVAWTGSFALEPRRPLPSQVPVLEVQAVSLDWKWLFIYPKQEVAVVNELVLPTGTPVRFRLTSATVMNTFFIPQLGSMIYTMNGMETVLHLQADAQGDYRGMSAHFSGDGFPGMHFVTRAVPPAAFESWASQAKSDGPVLDKAAYAELLKESVDVKPHGFKGVEPGLFDAIVARTAPDAPGPPPSPAPGNDVHPNTPKQGG
jgi:cytochrome o ubiquinol oxidase subunit II